MLKYILKYLISDLFFNNFIVNYKSIKLMSSKSTFKDIYFVITNIKINYKLFYKL